MERLIAFMIDNLGKNIQIWYTDLDDGGCTVEIDLSIMTEYELDLFIEAEL